MNMAGQCLLQPSGWAAIIDLTGPERRKVSYGDLSKIVDGLARAMSARIAPGDRVGVLLGQSPWCAAAHLAI